MVIKNEGSTECILPKLERDESWSPRAELAIEEAQERSTIQETHSTRTSPSRKVSDRVSYERSISSELANQETDLKWNGR